MGNPNGYVLSVAANRVVIVTGVQRVSANAKTGDMLQVWILSASESPVDTVRNGHDSVICGDCIHGGDFTVRDCYVNVSQGPQSVWHAWVSGAYPYLPQSRYAEVFGGRAVRFGAYGDPAFIPVGILRYIAFFAAKWTGYTHQWRVRRDLAPYLMASCDSEADYADAIAAGWRSFRVRSPEAQLLPGEITCPASDEAGHRTQCAKCGLCNGSHRNPDKRANISIIVHGAFKARFNRNQLIQIGGVS